MASAISALHTMTIKTKIYSYMIKHLFSIFKCSQNVNNEAKIFDCNGVRMCMFEIIKSCWKKMLTHKNYSTTLLTIHSNQQTLCLLLNFSIRHLVLFCLSISLGFLFLVQNRGFSPPLGRKSIKSRFDPDKVQFFTFLL
jgi:hypothetical protein